MSESFAELFEQSFASQQIRPGAILTGKVVEINDDVVIVSAGLKSESVIPAEQFKNEKGEFEVAVGDEVEVALDAVEDGFGETRLSRDKAKRARTWTMLEEAFEQEDVVNRPGPCLPAGVAGRRTPGAGSQLPRGQDARVQGHQAGPQA
jgi:small subunit ribosomal protein S1